jgi:hypothetical protein
MNTEPEEKSNLAKGRTSYDARIDGAMVTFFNRNVSPYPTEAGGPKFDLVPVTKQKDVMLNVARMYAQQEYDRIMDMVRVLERQAQAIQRRLMITDQVHAAEYQFQVCHGRPYWLVFDSRKNITRLVITDPDHWFIPDEYEYIARVMWLGDYTWVEVDADGKPV